MPPCENTLRRRNWIGRKSVHVFIGIGERHATRFSSSEESKSGGHWKQPISTFRLKTATGFSVPSYQKARPIIERRLAAVGPEPGTRLFSFDNCKKGIEAACKRLGFPHFTLRSLRRMFITRALMRGVDVQTVSRWQGHVDGGALLLRTYAHVLSREHSQRMASLMGDEPANVAAMPAARHFFR